MVNSAEVVWKDVVGYEDLFMVCEDGRVFSKRTGRILKQTTSKTGYFIFVTRIGGRKGVCKCFKVHRLLAIAFLENPEDKPYVNHIDGDKKNNHVSNLEWCTARENTMHSLELGLSTTKHLLKLNASNRKLTSSDIKYIRENYRPLGESFTQRELALKYNVCKSTIRAIVYNERYLDV